MRSRRLLLTTELASPPTTITNSTDGRTKQLEKPRPPPIHGHDANSTTNSFNQTTTPFNSSMVVTILVLLTALFFMGFFSVYVRHFTEDSSSGDAVRRRTIGIRQSSATSGGLDRETIVALPTFPYKSVNDDEPSLCAVCLGEFESGEAAKLLPFCGHFFHVECIDAWLASHISCPLCRSTFLPRSLPAKEEEVPEEEEPPVNEVSDEVVVMIVSLPSAGEPESEEVREQVQHVAN